MTVLQSSVQFLNGWYWQDDVWRIILQYLGCLIGDFHLERKLRRLSASANLKEFLCSSACEYLSLCGKQISEDKGKKSTGRSITMDQFTDYYINFEDPVLEILQSTWQNEINAIPKRTIFYLDLEYYNNYSYDIALIDQFDLFKKLEPFYWLVKNNLLNFGIDHIAISSGRGYNFLCIVPWDSSVFKQLIEIAPNIEKQVLERQKYPEPKRWRAISPYSEMSFRGMMRLVIYFMGLVIRQAILHKVSHLNIGFSDGGGEGISFDPTFITRAVDKNCFGVPCSPYLKLHFLKYTKNAIVEHTPIPVRLIRSRGNKEYFPNLNEFCLARWNYKELLNYWLPRQTGFIPDGSTGLQNLINSYKNSNLKKIYDWMDSEEHDRSTIWWRTYRNYDKILFDYPQLRYFVENANPQMLKPDSLRYVINFLFDRGWSPKHIGGFIRAIYENPQYWWKNDFFKYPSARWANGWVEIFMAERFI